MNFFRSEEHAARFNARHSLVAGATIGAAKMCELAHAWWDTRLASDWCPRTRDESQVILDRVGLTGEFWRLA